MNKIFVNLKERHHIICIGEGILNRIGNLLSKEKIHSKCAIVTNPTVNALYGDKVKKSLESIGLDVFTLEVPDKETSKSLKEAENLYVKLLSKQFDRSSCVIALGGGVIGDLAGFVAATYMRGVNLVQAPTTLLAQVDSAIGGKTAVNLPQGKNLIGVFYQPNLVVSDVGTLKTLPEKELRNGLAEVIKYGIILDPVLFETIEKNIEKIKSRDMQILTEIVTRCSEIKVEIVKEDEKEKGKRMTLNLGHTLGHALEAIKKYTKISHGEAVSIGIVFCAKISNELGMLDINEFERIVNLLQSAGLPTTIGEQLDTDRLLETMLRDKKVDEGKLRLILPKKIGRVVITNEVPERLWKRKLEEMIG